MSLNRYRNPSVPVDHFRSETMGVPYGSVSLLESEWLIWLYIRILSTIWLVLDNMFPLMSIWFLIGYRFPFQDAKTILTARSWR